MKLKGQKNQTFHRIGDQYAPLIDPDHFLGRNAFEDVRSAEPKANLKEFEKSGHLEIVLPGFDKDEINIILENNTLLVSAKKAGYQHDVTDNYKRREFNPYFQIRYFHLCECIDQEHISSSLENGILDIHLPKRTDVKEFETRQIEVM